MRLKTIITFFLFLFTWLNSFGQKVENKAFNGMLKALLTNSVPAIDISSFNPDSSFLILDARAFEEYQVSHIEGAEWVGYDLFNIETLDTVDINQSIVVYCSIGYRSEKVAEQLIDAGFINTQNLYGGIFEWANQHNVLIDSNGDETNIVHAFSRLWGVWLENGEKVY